MSSAEGVEQLTIEEFVRLYEQQGAFEIIDGEWREIMPPVMVHIWMVRTLFRILDNFCVKNDLGEVVTEGPFVLTYSSNWVKGSRSPDIMFFEKSRWNEYIAKVPDWLTKPAVLVPDLAVEVVSQNDSYSELNRKVQVYRQDGVKLIWVLDPAKKSVDVYQGNQITTLEKDATLTGATLVPGLEIRLSDLFAEVDQADEE